MKKKLSKEIGNYFLNELLAIKNEDHIFYEIGSIINETTLNFIIYASTDNCKTIRKVAEETFYKKYWAISLVLEKKYSLIPKIKFVNKKFSQKDIQKFTYYYFIPEKTNNRYVFKYISINENLKKLLTNNSFWFNSPKNFSDITDCKFEIDTEPSRKNILDFYYQKQLHNFNDENKIMKISDFENTFEYPSNKQFNADLLEHQYNGTISKLGVTCFSEKYDNKLMWDNYANGSKGVCLIFDTIVSNDKFYKFEGTKVKYSKTLPKYFFDASGKMEIGHIVFSKTNEYKFENEIRECLSFQINDKIDRNVQFNPIALRGIIFGASCTENNKEIIKQLISKKKYINIELIESSIDSKMNIKLSKHNIHLKDKKGNS